MTKPEIKHMLLTAASNATERLCQRDVDLKTIATQLKGAAGLALAELADLEAQEQPQKQSA